MRVGQKIVRSAKAFESTMPTTIYLEHQSGYETRWVSSYCNSLGLGYEESDHNGVTIK